MRKLALSLVAAVAVVSTGVQASELTEAIKAGKVSADASIYYESRNPDKETTTYFSDTAYAVGTVGLAYTTGSYNNLSAKVGFRGFKALWEADEDFVTAHGTGDASERIYEEKGGKGIVSDLYIMYKNDMITAKIGRQPLSTEFLGKRHDAFSMYANLTPEAQAEFIYTQGQVKANYHEFQPLTDKPGDGLYKLGLSYKFSEMFNAKIYGIKAPDAYKMYGAKANLSAGGFGFFTQYTKTDEDANDLKKSFLKLQVSTKIAGIGTAVGYTQAGKDGFKQPGYNATGNPFEEGDKIFDPDSKTKYVKLDKSFGNLSLTALYGIFDYGATTEYTRNELNIIAGYKINKDMSAKLWFVDIKEDEKETARPDLQQLSFLVQYKF